MNHSGKNPFEAIIFDLGSTLIHFEGDLSEAISGSILTLVNSLREFGVNINHQNFRSGFLAEMEKYRAQRDSQFVEYTTAYILRTYLSTLGHARVPGNVIRKALKDMYSVTQARWKVEHDAVPTLKNLQERDYRLGIISNAADDEDVQVLVDKAQIRPYFDFVLSSAAQGIRKPEPSIFKTALDHWQLKPHQVAMVGDTLEADILGARRVGIFAIWITRRAVESPGSQIPEAITPDATINSLDQLPLVLDKFEG